MSFLRDRLSTNKAKKSHKAEECKESPFNRNLLADFNPDGDEITKHCDPRWQFINKNSFQYMSPPIFSVEHFAPDFVPKFDGCYELSNQTASRLLDCSFKDLGFSDEVIEKNRPSITFTEYVAHRADCGSRYFLSVCLFDENGIEVNSQETTQVFEQWQLQKWVKKSITFTSYDPSVRRIRIESGGKDTQNWAGYYGPKIAGSSLVIGMTPFDHNLLSDFNPKGDKITKHCDPRWQFINKNSFQYMSPPIFAVGHFAPDFEPKFDGCYELSFETATRVLDCSFKDLGISDEIIEKYRPHITFTEYVANRADCGSCYFLRVRLFDENGVEVHSQETTQIFEQWQLQKWVKKSITFISYDPSVRRIRVESGGKDTQNWAGFYGPKIAGSSLVIGFEATPETESDA